MAGEWLKMRLDLAEDPAVIAMAAELDVDEDLIVGKLHRLWSWADRQSRDGHATGVTGKWIDRFIRLDGFAGAMCRVSWLVIDPTGIAFPNFDRHNGETAKTRALGAKRQQKARSGGNAPVTPASRPQRDGAVTREEKRREESEAEGNGDTGLTATGAQDAAGTFEGHENPVTTPNPVAGFAVALTRAGFSVTSLNPDLVAYVDAGGSVEHLIECAKHPDCQGKKATYPIRMARRELADRAAPIALGPPREVRAAAPSKHLAGVAGFLGVESHELIPGAGMVRAPDRAGLGEPVPADARRLPRQ